MANQHPTTNGGTTYPLPYIKTPLIPSTALSKLAGSNIHLKLETLQPSGSFKSRGIGNFMLSHLKASAANAVSSTSQADAATTAKPHFYSSSGGNAGLACVVASSTLGCAATIVVPKTTSQYMIEKMYTAGATEVVQRGESWAEADAFLRETYFGSEEGTVNKVDGGGEAVYVHPFEGEAVWEGHSSLVEEVVEQLAVQSGSGLRPDLVICSVGGGGLFAGVMRGLERAGMKDVPVLGVETKGADSFAQAVDTKELVTLDGISSIANTLGARRVCAEALKRALDPETKVQSLVLSDKEAVRGCLVLADEHRMLVEAACGVAVAAVLDEERLRTLYPWLNEQSNVVVVICGGTNVTIDLLQNYKKDFDL